MTRARTLADMISDGVIGTTELADDAITPVKLDETGNYEIAGLTVSTSLLGPVAIESTHNGAYIKFRDSTSSPSNQYAWMGVAGNEIRLFVNDTEYPVAFNSGGALFNPQGGDNDFRVLSDATNYALFVDGGANSGYGRVKISSSTISTNTSTLGGDADTYINGLTIENNEASYTNGGLSLVNKYDWGYGSSIEWRNIYDTNGGTLGATNRITSQWRTGGHYSLDFFSMRSGSLVEHLSLGYDQSVFNEDSLDQDFRVESDSETHMLFVDAALNRVGIGTNGPASTLSVDGDILSNWGNSGEQKIGIAGRTANVFSTTGRTLVLTGADAIAGPQAMAGGDVIVRGGKGRANVGLNTYAGHLYLEGGEHTTSGETSGAGNVYIRTAGQTRGSFYAGGDIALSTNNYSQFFKLDHSTNEIMIGQTLSNDAELVTLGSAGQATYSSGASEGMLGLVRFNNTGNPNQHSGLFFRVTSNNGSNNANASIGLKQPSSSSHNSQFYFNLRSQSQNRFSQYGLIDSENGWIFNDGGDSYNDFRVESDTDTHAIFVDAGNNRVNIHASSGENLMNLNAAGVSSHTSGTLPPGLTLYNSNTGNGTGNAITWKDATGAQGIAGIASFRNSNAGGYARDLRFYVNNAAATNAFQERLRIDRDGNVMMGNTLDFPSSNFRTQSGFRFRQAGDANYLEQIRTTTSDSSANFYMGNNLSGYRFFSFNNSASQIGSISNSGNNSVSYNTTSDYRLKENVEDIADGITRVKQLQPRRFSWISEETDAPTVDGFIAHEAQTVVPEAVHGTHNEVDDDGNPVYQGIDQAKLVPLLTAALQEAITKIETLETQRADMEARLTALESA